MWAPCCQQNKQHCSRRQGLASQQSTYPLEKWQGRMIRAEEPYETLISGGGVRGPGWGWPAISNMTPLPRTQQTTKLAVWNWNDRSPPPFFSAAMGSSWILLSKFLRDSLENPRSSISNGQKHNLCFPKINKHFCGDFRIRFYYTPNDSKWSFKRSRLKSRGCASFCNSESQGCREHCVFPQGDAETKIPNLKGTTGSSKPKYIGWVSI